MFDHLSKNQVFLVISIGISIFLTILSGLLLVEYTKDARAGSTALSVLCTKAINSSGFLHTTTAEGFTVTRKTTVELERAVYESAVASAHCVGYEIKSYCAGPSCAEPGVTFNLEPIK